MQLVLIQPIPARRAASLWENAPVNVFPSDGLDAGMGYPANPATWSFWATRSNVVQTAIHGIIDSRIWKESGQVLMTV
jgi:hypothetical protein